MEKKFSYNPPEVFESSSSYPNPQNERETREQLSRPLNQIRDYINNELSTEIKAPESTDGTITIVDNGQTIDMSAKTYVEGEVATLNNSIIETNTSIETTKTELQNALAEGLATKVGSLTSNDGSIRATNNNDGSWNVEVSEEAVTKVYEAQEEAPADTSVLWIDTNDDSGTEIDTAMSDTSTNPVQNKVIKAYVDSHGGGGTGEVTKKYVDEQDTKTLQNAKTYTDGKVPTAEEKLAWNNKANTSDIPTKLSELTNDTNFAKTSDIPTKTSQLTNDSNFLTQHQSLTEYAKTTEVDAKLSNKVDNAKDVVKLWKGTQAEYDLLAEKDNPTTIYFITE